VIIEQNIHHHVQQSSSNAAQDEVEGLDRIIEEMEVRVLCCCCGCCCSF
jgi:hypothetical protein